VRFGVPAAEPRGRHRLASGRCWALEEVGHLFGSLFQYAAWPLHFDPCSLLPTPTRFTYITPQGCYGSIHLWPFSGTYICY